MCRTSADLSATQLVNLCAWPGAKFVFELNSIFIQSSNLRITTALFSVIISIFLYFGCLVLQTSNMSSKNESYPPLDLKVLKSQNNKRVSYYYDEEVANHHYRDEHPMQPQRIKMTHSLTMHTGIYKKLSILVRVRVSKTPTTD